MTRTLEIAEADSGTPHGSTFRLPWVDYWDYCSDVWQRNVLFLDVMRQRGNQYLEHAAQPVQHVLHYDFEVVMDGRHLERPVNYGLVRILPPEGIEIDENKRPFVVVDPRAGHGPGIGGFKKTSEVGAILKAGHPCYFVGFLSDPMPGQTIEDVGRAEIVFIQTVAERHPTVEGKPCVIGNCQAGWAMIMVAAHEPDLVGPILMAGAPISYWAGVRGKNPMRYAGGLLGGTWMTSLTSDLGHGIFDGAYLVQNMENLKPDNTLWTKQYNLWSRVDTEAERYLEFERWWGGHVLMTGEEMQFITDDLFVGNKLVQGEVETSDGQAIDLRNIKSPIVVFCSHGDNITPPQQALGWILDLYEDVDEVRAYGQTIVYALHHDIGHLGIFVSGSVGKKEHDQFTQNMDLIDVLPPGLYEAVIREKTDEDENADLAYGDYIVSFEARSLDDIRALGDRSSVDDRAFETVARVSEINKSLYSTFASPVVRSAVTEQSAKWQREMHPSRLQYRVFSDENPFMSWTAPAAEAVRTSRHQAADNNPFRLMEQRVSEGIVTWLRTWGDLRDQACEQLFFSVYGSEFLQSLVGLGKGGEAGGGLGHKTDPEHEALVRDRLRDLKARIGKGGLVEATTRALLYVGLPDGTVDERGFGALRQIHEETPENDSLTLDGFKQIAREQYFMLLLDEEAALAALPKLLPDADDARQAFFANVLRVSASDGIKTESERGRLVELAARIGVTFDPTASTHPPKVVTSEKPKKRATSARKPRRRATKRR